MRREKPEEREVDILVKKEKYKDMQEKNLPLDADSQKAVVTQMARDMKEYHLKEICTELIWDLIPQINEINVRLSKECGRQVMDNITWRVKAPESIVKKLKRKGRKLTFDCALETLNDLAGIRVICSFQDDVYRMAEEIRDIPGLRIVKEKNYIAHPKDSGYRSIHLIVEYNGDGAFMDECCEAADIRESLRAEIQIRSVAMNYWAILDHQLCYKNEKKEAQKIKKELKACAIAIAKIDKRFLKLRKRIEDL